CGGGVVELLTHPHVLGSLPREDKGNLGLHRIEDVQTVALLDVDFTYAGARTIDRPYRALGCCKSSFPSARLTEYIRGLRACQMCSDLLSLCLLQNIGLDLLHYAGLAPLQRCSEHPRRQFGLQCSQQTRGFVFKNLPGGKVVGHQAQDFHSSLSLLVVG